MLAIQLEICDTFHCMFMAILEKNNFNNVWRNTNT